MPQKKDEPSTESLLRELIDKLRDKSDEAAENKIRDVLKAVIEEADKPQESPTTDMHEIVLEVSERIFRVKSNNTIETMEKGFRLVSGIFEGIAERLNREKGQVTWDNADIHHVLVMATKALLNFYPVEKRPFIMISILLHMIDMEIEKLSKSAISVPIPAILSSLFRKKEEDEAVDAEYEP